MLKRILCATVVLALLAVSGAIIGCEEDEVKVRRESTTTTTEQKEVVVP